MCIQPSYIYVTRAGLNEQQPVPCKKCWRCKENKKNDYVGRSLAEASLSDWTVTLTLTYREPDPGDIYADQMAHKIITPPHFQKFIRSLRKRGHCIRYLASGEYGELEKRAHFHCILFGRGKRPKFPQKEMFDHKAWPHGHMKADWNADENAIRYICKYLTKDQNKGNEAWFSISKKPSLGSDWFHSKAMSLIELGALPTSFEYLPPGGHKNRPYLMTGATKRDYLRTCIMGYIQTRNLDPRRLSEWVRKAKEKLDRDDFRKWHEEYTKDYSVDEYIADMLEALDRDRLSDRAVVRALIDTSELMYEY